MLADVHYLKLLLIPKIFSLYTKLQNNSSCVIFAIKNAKPVLKKWCYYLHWLRDSVAPVCRIFSD